jgi:Fic-DOC domain mobile mystery protein B
MVGPLEAGNDGTSIDPQEREGLIPTHITTREQLNELEAKNILEAIGWAFDRKRNITDETFLLGLHRRMFRKVWRWAGRYRTTERNLGSLPHRIQVDLHAVLDNVRYWIGNETFPPDEIAVRFHHGLVLVHPFANGNGRWSRLAADILIVQLGGDRFSWGAGADLQKVGEDRDRYIASLKLADNHDIRRLLEFARS